MNTGKIKIHYSKPKTIDLAVLDKQYGNSVQEMNQNVSSTTQYAPFSIQNLQLYNPIYRRFFEMTPNNYGVIALNHHYHIQDIEHVMHMVPGTDQSTTIEKKVFVKFSPLLDPYRYMIGKYDVQDPRIRAMPDLNSTEETVHPKILSTNNASYVDCFFNYLSSGLMHNHGLVNGIDFYGSFLGVQNQFRVSVTDDLDYLRGSDFFQKHVGELFHIDEPEDADHDDLAEIGGSRRNKRRLVIDNMVLDETDIDPFPLLVDDLIALENPNPLDVVNLTCETVYVKSNQSNQSSIALSHNSSKSSMNSALNYSSDEGEDQGHQDQDDQEDDEDKWTTDDSSSENGSRSESGSGSETGSDDGSECEPEEIYGYIRNFPVQMICLEKCDGTLDELFVRHEIDEKIGASALFQVIMTLLAYQKAFKFTHNDLHTNNIMFMKTDVEFLTYKYAGKTYRVPTYGRIFKIIDFGRSIYRFQDQIFCSDSFAPGGDANTQYNCEPFMNQNKPRLDPNYSFDLCRLGASIFDFILNIDIKTSEMDGLQETIHRWCLDDNGKNVLYKKNGEDRYPCFKLYKMIARSVHAHCPEAQLTYPIFSQFLIKSELVKNEVVMDLDSLPNYVSSEHVK